MANIGAFKSPLVSKSQELDNFSKISTPKRSIIDPEPIKLIPAIVRFLNLEKKYQKTTYNANTK
ncbi:hypothetical protein DHD32_10605 [Arenibacter sp. TNZ]|jgi:hypothetical protein|nr:hypothetical protein [Arenibacter sp. TNZ]